MSRLLKRQDGCHISEGYISVAGGKIWYRIVGVQKKGIPLLVVHGGPGATHDYLETIGDISVERPVIFYDQLGAGRSDKPFLLSLYNIDRFANELDLLIRHLDFDKIHILGASWGTMLIAEYMAVKPENNILSIVFSGPAISAKLFTEDIREYIYRLAEQDQRAIFEAERTGIYGDDYYHAVQQINERFFRLPEPLPECLKRTLDNMSAMVYEYMWGPSEFTCTGVLKGFDRVNILPDIQVPVLFTCGSRDEVSPQTAGYYSDHLPGSRVVIFENSTHMHHLESRALYNHTIAEFLRNSEAG